VLLQLLETADESTKDVGGLNSKLNRKRYKGAKNSTVQESFIRRSMDNMGAMDNNLSVFGDNSRTNKDEMSANLGEPQHCLRIRALYKLQLLLLLR